MIPDPPVPKPTPDTDRATSAFPRRVVLTAAGWAVPAIGLSMATPARAASVPARTIAFDRPTYAAQCGRFGPAVIRVTTNGAPGVGVSMTVTLGRCLQWSDGSSGARVLTTDTAGQVRLDGVRAPIHPWRTTITAALATGEAATAEVVANTPPATAWSRNELGTPKRFAAVPAEAQAIARDVFLTTGGEVWVGDSRVVTGVRAAVGESSTAGVVVSYIGADGVAASVAGGRTARFTSVPATATPIGRDTFLDRPSGVVWIGNEPVLRDIARANADSNADNEIVVTYVTTGGVAGTGGQAPILTWRAVPPSADPVGRDLFLTPDGTLYVEDNVVARGVQSTASDTTRRNDRVVSWVDASGAHSGNAGPYGGHGFGTRADFGSVPRDARAVSRDTFLTPAGALYRRDALVASPVSSAAAETVPTSDDIVTSYTIATC